MLRKLSAFILILGVSAEPSATLFNYTGQEPEADAREADPRPGDPEETPEPPESDSFGATPGEPPSPVLRNARSSLAASGQSNRPVFDDAAFAAATPNHWTPPHQPWNTELGRAFSLSVLASEVRPHAPPRIA